MSSIRQQQQQQQQQSVFSDAVKCNNRWLVNFCLFLLLCYPFTLVHLLHPHHWAPVKFFIRLQCIELHAAKLQRDVCFARIYETLCSCTILTTWSFCGVPRACILCWDGLGEPIRMLFVDQDIKFVDDRFNRDDWPTLKSQFQFGQVPCLYDGDDQIVQSGAILRHLARKHDLNGANERETTYADMFYEGIRDLHMKYTKMIYQAYETEKEPYIKNILPGELANLEKLLATRDGGKKFVLGEKISFVDYVLFEELDIHLILDPHCLDNFPLLKGFHQRMLERPRLKAYCEKRSADKVPVNGNGKQ